MYIYISTWNLVLLGVAKTGDENYLFTGNASGISVIGISAPCATKDIVWNLRLDLECAVWIHMIVHASIVRRRRKAGCWRWPQLESLRWILFWISSVFWICRNSTLQWPSISRDLPVSQVYFNAAGRLLATSRQTLLHCHWANTTRPLGQRFHRNPGWDVSSIISQN